MFFGSMYSKTCVKRPLSKRPKIGFQYQLSLNAGLKYCRMLQGEHSTILLTFIKLSFVIKIFVLSIFERPFYTGFTVVCFCSLKQSNMDYNYVQDHPTLVITVYLIIYRPINNVQLMITIAFLTYKVFILTSVTSNCLTSTISKAKNQQQNLFSFFLSIFTGSLIHERYTRECEFGNFDKIKKKKKKKNTKTFG